MRRGTPVSFYAGLPTAMLSVILSLAACSQETPIVSRADIVRLDPAVDSIVPLDVEIERLADGFSLTEGPVWDRDGYLLFSDLRSTHIYKWLPSGEISVFRAAGRHAGNESPEYSFPNGLTFDRDGRLTICEHGNRRVSRLENDGSLTVLADRYEGKRLNSPNDLVYRSDGRLYFTDPPSGLPKMFDDPRKELPYSGVFSLHDGTLRLLSTDLSRPNGLAFSSDEKYLYVTNSGTEKKIVMRYESNPDGTLSQGVILYDMRTAAAEGTLDGMKVDQQGHLYVTGPGGVWIISPSGKHLGTIKGPKQPANIAWGDQDGKTLYLTAVTGLYRIRLNIPGIRP